MHYNWVDGFNPFLLVAGTPATQQRGPHYPGHTKLPGPLLTNECLLPKSR